MNHCWRRGGGGLGSAGKTVRRCEYHNNNIGSYTTPVAVRCSFAACFFRISAASPPRSNCTWNILYYSVCVKVRVKKKKTWVYTRKKEIERAREFGIKIYRFSRVTHTNTHVCERVYILTTHIYTRIYYNITKEIPRNPRAGARAGGTTWYCRLKKITLILKLRPRNSTSAAVEVEGARARTARKSLILYTRGPVLFIDGHNPYCVGACVWVCRCGLGWRLYVIRVCIYTHIYTMMMMILLYTLLRETDIIYINGWSSSSGGEIVYVNVVGKSPHCYVYIYIYMI